VRSLVAALFFGCAASPAAARCDVLAAFAQVLPERYDEQLVGYGLASDTQLLQLWVSAEGSFTILAVRPDGMACIVAAGHDWAYPVPAAQPEGEPS